MTKQTGPAGKQVNRLYIEDGADIDRELYLSILVDRSVGRWPSSFRPRGAMDMKQSPNIRREDRPRRRSIRKRV